MLSQAEEEAPGKKRKKTLKQRMAALREEKAARKVARQDPDFDPVAATREQMDTTADADPIPVEGPGEAAARLNQKQRKRVSRERLRGVSANAMSMQRWLQSHESDDSRSRIDREAAELASTLVESAIEASIDIVEQEAVEAARAEKAARERQRYRQGKRKQVEEATPPPRRVSARPSRTLSGGSASNGEARSSRGRTSRKRQPAARLTSEIVAIIDRICDPKRKHCLMRSDVVGGENLSKAEWAVVQNDDALLQRIYAFNVFVKARSEGVPQKLITFLCTIGSPRATFDHILIYSCTMKGGGVNRDQKNFSL